MYKNKIELVTNSDMVKFVEIVSDVNGKVKLIDGNGYCVNGKSLLGVAATVEWNELYCESEVDIYSKIKQFCV